MSREYRQIHSFPEKQKRNYYRLHNVLRTSPYSPFKRINGKLYILENATPENQRITLGELYYEALEHYKTKEALYRDLSKKCLMSVSALRLYFHYFRFSKYIQNHKLIKELQNVLQEKQKTPT